MKIKNSFSGIVYIILVTLILALFMAKSNYHIDELLSFELSNDNTGFEPEFGVRYEPAGEPFVEHLSSDGNLDFSNVWLRQTEDTHPPFFYVVFHSLSSLFPHVVTMRFGAMINAAFAVITLFFIRKISEVLVPGDGFFKNIISTAYVFSAGILSIATFIRMYVMVACFTTIFAYFVLKYIEKFNIKVFLIMFFVTVLGALTQYYFIISAFFISFIACVYLIYNKRLIELIEYCVTMALAGVTSYLAFPAMIEHMFMTSRGKESVDNMLSTSFSANIRICLDVINKELFGGFLGALFVVMCLAFIVDFVRQDRNKQTMISCEKRDLIRCALLFLPALFFTGFVAKSAPYLDARYLSPMFPLILVAVYYVLYVIIRAYFRKEKNIKVLLSSLMIVLSLVGLLNQEWPYLNLSSKEMLSYAETFSKRADAICAYSEGWKMQTAYLEVAKCRSSVFYQVGTYDEFESEVNPLFVSDKVVLFLATDDNALFFQKFMDGNSDFKLIKTEPRGYYESYYLEKTDS